MSRWSLGRILVSLVSLWAAFGSYVFDWNQTHIFNPRWTPHAKFHNAQTMLLGTCLGLFALALLWLAKGPPRLLLQVASVLASLYWLTQIGSTTFPGTALVDSELARPGQLPEQLIVDAVMLTTLTLGYLLESRRLARA